jgi:Tfp pilus assembly protein PilX
MTFDGTGGFKIKTTPAGSKALGVMALIPRFAAGQSGCLSPALQTKRRGERGVALILTLAVVALLTIMLVAFVSLASRDRNATQSYTQSLRADQIGLSGLDQVVSQIQAEISDPQNSTVNGSASAFPIYIPQDPANAVPQRMVSSAVAPIITMSGSSVYGNATNFASTGNLTTAASLNNRSISISRWCKPQLLSPSATNSFTSPSWVIVTRNGPKSSTGSTPGSASLTMSGLNNMNAALGRYAYVVYDTSGLVDINSAGYPSTAASAAAVKGVLPWADLTQIAGTITQTDIDNLVKWRNAANAATYSTYVTNIWSTNGFMRVAPGDTTFLTRQELIKYAATQNADLANALPYLTTFSREVNGPTWQPTTPAKSSIDYTSLRTTPNTTNPAIFNPRVAAGGWTRDNGTTAVTGEPLVKYRFPLDRLALLEKQGTTGLSTQDTSDILKYFGLRLFNDSKGLYRHWVYTNPAGTASATTILPLDQVAALNREPDFFELLQAGILSGSLGMFGRADNTTAGQWALNFGPPGFIDTDKRADYQIIRIGANIIDQWDADSNPTTITYNGEDFYGIEDLPYINKIFARVNGGGAPWFGGIPTTPYNYYLYFELWNPHQQVGADPNYPTQFQIAPLPENGSPPKQDCFALGIFSQVAPSNPEASANPFNWWYYNLGTGAWANTPQYTTFSSLTGGGIISFTASAAAPVSDYREPAIIPSTSAGWAGGPNYATLSLGQIPAFPVGVPSNNNVPWPWPSANTDPTSLIAPFSQRAANLIINAAFQLQYSDASGWHTYATFEGLADPNLPNGYLENISLIPQQSNNVNTIGSFPKSDPRTFRFGPGESLPNFLSASAPNLPSEGNTLTPTAGTLFSPVYGNLAPFLGSPPSSYANPVRIDMWSVNDSTVSPSGSSFAAGSNYTDMDGVQRFGDAHYAYSANSPYFTAGATMPARPIVLNRPFTSVGDLGFAYRDMPWKTLDLFSPTSADAGLLDLFTLTDGPVIAGRVNPNTAPTPVLQALLSGELANYSGANTNLTTTAATSIAAALSTATATTPFLNRASFVQNFMTNSAVNSFSTIKPEREAVIRSLAESANTRTWNFLIDIIAQSGGYPKTATTLDNFLVTGERRYWLHIAIDRYTGQVVDKQLEIVNE